MLSPKAWSRKAGGWIIKHARMPLCLDFSAKLPNVKREPCKAAQSGCRVRPESHLLVMLKKKL
jgi:hypothetical protein